MSHKLHQSSSLLYKTPASNEAIFQSELYSHEFLFEQVYNYRDRIRREACEDRDIMGQFYHLATENKYVAYTKVHPTTRAVTHLFVAHPESLRLFRTFYYYVGMDSTYKTNRYNMPFFEMIGMTPGNKNYIVTLVPSVTHNRDAGPRRPSIRWNSGERKEEKRRAGRARKKKREG